MAGGAVELLDRATIGRVLTAFCDDVNLARHELRAATEEQEPVPTLVTLEWAQAPSLASELDEIRDALAEAAASLWPNWYITAERRFGHCRSPELDVETLLKETGRGASGVSSSWLRRAWQRCRDGQPPLVRHMAAAEQVRQLTLALDPQRLVFALSVASDAAPAARVRGLARAAEWLAHEAQAKALLLVPESWRSHPELDHVTYGAMLLRTAADAAPSALVERTQKYVLRDALQPAQRASAERDLPVQVVVGPVIGKPHPKSQVEQLLFECIGRDAELASLFRYNQRLTALGKHYIVDLVWDEGRLVVELDGPEHHNHRTYVEDRDRDYRLFMCGYSTLRVPNHDVCTDVELVLAKIRNVVGRLRALRKGSVSDELPTHP